MSHLMMSYVSYRLTRGCPKTRLEGTVTSSKSSSVPYACRAASKLEVGTLSSCAELAGSWIMKRSISVSYPHTTM